MAAEIPDGCVLIARAIFNSSLWTMPDTDRILAITLIGIANWQDKKWFDGEKEIVIKRGELVRSLEDLAEASRLTVKKVRTSLEHLEKVGFLARHPARRYTHVTLCKYDHYQNISKYSDTTSGTARARLGQLQGIDRATPGHEEGNKQEGEEREEWDKGEEGPTDPKERLVRLALKAHIKFVGRSQLRTYVYGWYESHGYQRVEQVLMDQAVRGKDILWIDKTYFSGEHVDSVKALREWAMRGDQEQAKKEGA